MMNQKRIALPCLVLGLALTMTATGAWANTPSEIKTQAYKHTASPVRIASNNGVREVQQEVYVEGIGADEETAFRTVPTVPRTPVTRFGEQAATIANSGHTSVLSYIRRYNAKLDPDQASMMADAIILFSQKYNVDYRLLTGVLAVESAFKSDAISSSGAIGLGQLKPATAKWLGVVNPFDPIDNIAGTTRFLSWLLNKYNGSLDHALAAYYQGPGYLDKNGITSICTPYLNKVNKALAMF
jgi:hypothetical protein